MKCQLAALCDAGNLSGNGKLNILGEFDTLFAPQVPAVNPCMVFVAKLKIGEPDIGAHTFHLRVVDEDMNLVTFLDGKFEVRSQPVPGIESGFPVILQIGNAAFEDYGTYTFELRVDNQWMCELPLHVRKTSPA
jgi:hypothetical protein